MLRDRLVCGIADKRVQDRYLREAKLTYAEALEMALAAETVAKDSEKLHAGCDDSVPSALVAVTHREETVVQQIRTMRLRPSRRGSPTAHKEPQCYRCGGKHDSTRCRFKDYECHYCKKRGNLAAAYCKKKQAERAQNTEQAHQVEVAPSTQEKRA